MIRESGNRFSQTVRLGQGEIVADGISADDLDIAGAVSIGAWRRGEDPVTIAADRAPIGWSGGGELRFRLLKDPRFMKDMAEKRAGIGRWPCPQTESGFHAHGDDQAQDERNGYRGQR
jgi:hypothetical protein